MMIATSPTGSHLYGTAHAGSDKDTYSIHTEMAGTKHTICGEDDDLRIGLDPYIERLTGGAPQAVEMRYSGMAWYHPAYRPFLLSLEPDPAMLTDRYERAIRNFLDWEDKKASPKRRRHAIRLTINREQYHRYGFINPTMTPAQKALIAEHSEQMHSIEDILELLSEHPGIISPR